MTFQLRPWPEAKKLIPVISKSDRESLAASLEVQGQKYPVLCLADGRIFDGMSRFAILGDATKYQVLDLSEEAALGLARSLNISRRQLSGDQLREAMQELKENAITLRKKGLTLEEIAGITGVSKSTLSLWFTNSSTGNDELFDQRRVMPQAEHERIYQRVETGEPQQDIAAEYKVAKSRISEIVNEQRVIHHELNQHESERNLDQYKDVLQMKHGVLKQLPRELQVPAADATMVKGLSLPQVRRLVEAKPATAADIDAIAERIQLQKVKDRAKNHDYVKLRGACPWCTQPIEVLSQRHMLALRKGESAGAGPALASFRE